MPIRICHVTSVHDLRQDARIVPKMAVSAALAGHEVVVIAPRRNGMVLDSWSRAGVQVRTVSLPDSRLRRWRNLHKVISLAASQESDVYHLHDPELLPFAAQMRNGHRAGQVVMDFHEIVWADWLDKHYLPRPVRRAASSLWPVLEKRWLRRVDGIVIAGDGYRKLYQNSSAPLEIIWNYPVIPADSSKRPAVPRPGQRLEMIYVGAIMPTRAILEIIQAAQVVARKWPGGARLHVYGPLDDREYVARLRAASSRDLISLPGVLPQARLLEILSRMHVSFALFYDRPSNYDALPTKILESMLAGVPVVANDRPVIRKHLAPPAGGLLVDCLEPAEIAGRVLEIASSPKFYEDAWNVARNRVITMYNWQSQNRRLLAFYHRLLERASK